MSAPKEIIELVDRFNQYNSKYTSPSYNETQVRREFIDPFFKALGWDVDNNQGYDERYKEVIHEDAVKIGGKTKAPDYSFRIGGVRKFFVEAKKPAVNLKENPEPAYQLRRYAWSAKLPISILTDFEEFIVFDCTKKPSPKDPSSKGRIVYYTYTDYIEKWDEIENLFSKQQIPKGALDDLGESLIKKKGGKGTTGIDEAFLAEIEGWRDVLARNIALRNKELSVRELNLAVQKIIDRIIFLRICEDRGIEEYEQLKAYGDGKDIYKNLIKLFLHADDKYNSGLFHFKKEEGKDEPDILTNTLDIDDKVLKPILNNLYYPESPYEFSVLPADILGQVYEQFLGKVIRLTGSHQAKIEEKPEVKKAGGVFYTPTYIVDYIVRNTVGKLVVGKTPKEVSELKIVDPACGSGSFLIGAYQYLLDWHVSWYMDNLAPLLMEGKSATDKEVLELLPVKPKSKQKGRGRKKSSGSEHDFPIYQMSENDWRLTSDEKKRILINNIHGVDIDQQAVEVTKLSLLLKVLEGEKSERITKQLTITQERVLPSLHNNIKCGNSLIGPDIYSDIQTTFDDDEEYYRINAFDWKREFSDIFKNGGFDVVIGNPPYVRIQAMKEWAPVEVEFYKRLYESASKGNYDIYVVFVEKGLSLLNKNGILGYILPHKFFNAKYGQPLRKVISEGKNLNGIVHFGHQQVFKNATTYTCLLFLSRKEQESFIFEKVDAIDSWRENGDCISGDIFSEEVTDQEWNFVVGEHSALFKKLDSMPVKLGDIADIFVGLQTSADKVFILTLIEEYPNYYRLKSEVLNEEINLEKGLLHPVLSGTDVKRYGSLPNRQYILFPYSVLNNKIEMIPFSEIEIEYPQIASYLNKNKKLLENREKGKIKNERWYGYIYLKNMTIQDKEKICVPRLVDKLHAAYDSNGSHFLDNVDVGGIILKEISSRNIFKYLLALLNSELLRWYFPFISAPFRGGYYSANKQFLTQIPIRTIDFRNSEDVARHDRMVSLVETMLDLNKKLDDAKLGSEKEMIQRRIDATDDAIDKLVYELYGLSEEEIAIIESS